MGDCPEFTIALPPYQYTGQQYDPETGLNDYGARRYDVSTARFLSAFDFHSAFRKLATHRRGGHAQLAAAEARRVSRTV
jgi:hypothetical protein